MTEDSKKNDPAATVEILEKEFIGSIESINRATASIFENSCGVFLPLKRIDKSAIQKEFESKGGVLVVKQDLFSRVEIRGRLLGQIHKDILEALMCSEKRFMRGTKSFCIETTSYKILKRLNKDPGSRKWLLEKIAEIKDCNFMIYHKEDGFEDEDGQSFGYISKISSYNGVKDLRIEFTSEYTAFLTKSELLDYSRYVDDIIRIRSPFVKAVVRYMLTHRGKGTKYKLKTIIERLYLDKLVSKFEIDQGLREIRKEDVREELMQNFGLFLDDADTLHYQADIQGKRHYYLSDHLN